MTKPRQIKHSVKHPHSNPKKLHKAAHRWHDDQKKEYCESQNHLAELGIHEKHPRWRKRRKLYGELETHYINRYMNEKGVDLSNLSGSKWDQMLLDWMKWICVESPTVYDVYNSDR